jgi:hypothetical protein
MKTFNSLIYCIAFVCLLVSCNSNDSIIDSPQDEELAYQETSWEMVKDFDSSIISFNQEILPILKKGRTRAISKNDYDGFILNEEEQKTITEKFEILNEEAKKMFLRIGLTENEIYEIIDEEHPENLSLGALLVMSAVHDNQLSTRAITGNSYLDCAIGALGGDLYGLGRSLYTHGLTKAAVKMALNATAKRLSGGIGAALIVAEWMLCVGGIG